MLCRINRWKVSAAIDSGKPMSSAVKGHLLRCASCREFAGIAEETGRRLTREAGVLIGSGDQALAERVKASPGNRLEAANSARWVDLSAKPMRSLRFPRVDKSGRDDSGLDEFAPGPRPGLRFRLKPMLAAAAAWIVIGAGVFWLARSRPQPTSGLTPPLAIEKPSVYLAAAIEKVNSPYDQEMRLWKQTLDGAAERIRAAFDIGLGEAR